MDMNNLTRREAISSIVLTSGAFAAGMLTGCSDPLKNEKMIYRPLGRTGLDVSAIGFGGECTSCRRCETRCPFRVGVAARMRKAAALFGC